MAWTAQGGVVGATEMIRTREGALTLETRWTMRNGAISAMHTMPSRSRSGAGAITPSESDARDVGKDGWPSDDLVTYDETGHRKGYCPTETKTGSHLSSKSDGDRPCPSAVQDAESDGPDPPDLLRAK